MSPSLTQFGIPGKDQSPQVPHEVRVWDAEDNSFWILWCQAFENQHVHIVHWELPPPPKFGLWSSSFWPCRHLTSTPPTLIWTQLNMNTTEHEHNWMWTQLNWSKFKIINKVSIWCLCWNRQAISAHMDIFGTLGLHNCPGWCEQCSSEVARISHQSCQGYKFTTIQTFFNTLISCSKISKQKEILDLNGILHHRNRGISIGCSFQVAFVALGLVQKQTCEVNANTQVWDVICLPKYSTNLSISVLPEEKRLWSTSVHIFNNNLFWILLLRVLFSCSNIIFLWVLKTLLSTLTWWWGEQNRIVKLNGRSLFRAQLANGSVPSPFLALWSEPHSGATVSHLFEQETSQVGQMFQETGQNRLVFFLFLGRIVLTLVVIS